MKRIITYVLLAATLCGCGIYGKYARPDRVKGNGLYGQDVAENADSSTLATLTCKEIFTDPFLQALIDTAMSANADMRVMELAVSQARSGQKASKWAFAPSLTFAPQGGYNINNTPGWSYTLPAAMDWEVDLFGRLLNQKRRADASLRTAQDAHDAVRTQIVATVASLYYQLLALDEQLAITDSTAAKWRETVRVMDLMKEAGMMNDASVSQTRATCMAIETGVLSLRQAVSEVETALCTLLMQSPHHIRRGTLKAQVMPQELQVGVSAQLLANRPDVRQAEHELEQAFYAENYARAQFYPTVTINGTMLWNGNFVKSLLGSLVQPILARRGLRTNLEVAKAQHEQALIRFEQALVKAGGEVNTALMRAQTARSKHEARTQQVESLTTALEQTRSLMTNGTTTYLEVIYAQQALLDAQTSQIQDLLDEAQAVVELYQALGGGTR